MSQVDLNCISQNHMTSADSAMSGSISESMTGIDQLEIVEAKEEQNQGDTLQPETDRKLKIHFQETKKGVREQLFVRGKRKDACKFLFEPLVRLIRGERVHAFQILVELYG